MAITAPGIEIVNATHLWTRAVDAEYTFNDFGEQTIAKWKHISVGGSHFALSCEGEKAEIIFKIKNSKDVTQCKERFGVSAGTTYLKIAKNPFDKGKNLIIEVTGRAMEGLGKLKIHTILEIKEDRGLAHRKTSF